MLRREIKISYHIHYSFLFNFVYKLTTLLSIKFVGINNLKNTCIFDIATIAFQKSFSLFLESKRLNGVIFNMTWLIPK
jgi:hypothetical protein